MERLCKDGKRPIKNKKQGGIAVKDDYWNKLVQCEKDCHWEDDGYCVNPTVYNIKDCDIKGGYAVFVKEEVS